MRDKILYGVGIAIFSVIILKSLAGIRDNSDPVEIPTTTESIIEWKQSAETTTTEEITTTVVAEVEEQTIEIVSSPQPIKCGWSDKIQLTQADFNLLCSTVYAEVGNQSIDTQILVALTILNRVNMDEFPDSVYEVIYQAGAYEVTKLNLWAVKWDERTEQAVTYALEENRHPKDLTCFLLGEYHSFGTPYVQSDQAFFSQYTPIIWEGV